MSRAAYPVERACYTRDDGENDDPANCLRSGRGLIGILDERTTTTMDSIANPHTYGGNEGCDDDR